MTVLVLAPLVMGGCGTGGSANLETFEDSASYAIGMNMGTTLRRTEAEVDMAALVHGLTDVLEDRETQLSESEAGGILQELSTRLEVASVERRKTDSEKNKQQGEAYRTENAKKTGVQTTASGLQYEVLQSSDGPKPKATDRVRVHYRGTLIDGKEFDSSYNSGQPVTFPLNRVISGWTEALQLMPVGSKYRIVLPPELGYGARGAPPDIGPDATLIFEVELLGIEQ